MNFDQLTRREREVLSALAEFGADKVAARHLGLSFRTVEHYLASAKKKIGIPHTVVAVVAYDRYVFSRGANYQSAE